MAKPQTVSRAKGRPVAVERVRAEAYTAAFAEARAEGLKLGADQERARLAGILMHEEAAGREKLARLLALEQHLEVNAAVAMLKLAGRSTEPQPSLAAWRPNVAKPAQKFEQAKSASIPASGTVAPVATAQLSSDALLAAFDRAAQPGDGR